MSYESIVDALRHGWPVPEELRLDLSGANFSGANLARANLARADLYKADLSRANLAKADLSGADLSGADLSEACLFEAKLSVANLSRANLSKADLSRADLSRANLSGSQGLTAPSEQLKPYAGKEGYTFFKVFSRYYHSPPTWEIKKGATLREVCGPLRADSCASGVNVATLDWIYQEDTMYDEEVWKVLIPWDKAADIVVPFNFEGKLRCSECVLLECKTLEEWEKEKN